MTLTMVRHGESVLNAQNRFTGRLDPALSETGRHQVERLAERMAERGMAFDLAFTSTLRRARNTAEAILRRVDCGRALTSFPDLDERDYGDLSGLTEAEAYARWGQDAVKGWRRGSQNVPPNGESLVQVAARLRPFLARQVWRPLRDGANILVVSHGNTLRALLMVLDRLDEPSIVDCEIATAAALTYRFREDGTIAERTLI